MRISDWSSDVCSSDLLLSVAAAAAAGIPVAGCCVGGITGNSRDDLRQGASDRGGVRIEPDRPGGRLLDPFLQRPFPRSETVDRHGWSASRWSPDHGRSEEHTSELQSLMRTSYDVFC